MVLIKSILIRVMDMYIFETAHVVKKKRNMKYKFLTPLHHFNHPLVHLILPKSKKFYYSPIDLLGPYEVDNFKMIIVTFSHQ